MKLLLIDNYDSFTYNIVQYFGELGATVEVYRNDEITLKDIAQRCPTHLVVSPGPCAPPFTATASSTAKTSSWLRTRS